MSGTEMIGETLATGIETAGSAAATVTERGSEVIGTVASVPEKALAVVGPAEQGMLDLIRNVGPDPDKALQALAVMPINLPTPKPEALPQVPTPATPAPGTNETPDVIDATFKVISADSAVTTRPRSDVATVQAGPVVPVHGEVVPVDEPIDVEWRKVPGRGEGDLPPAGENPYQPIFEQVQPLSVRWTKVWGETSPQHLLQIFPLMHNEKISRKANVIFAALIGEHVPLDRMVTSVLYSLEPEEVDLFLTKVKAALEAEEGKASTQAEQDQGANPASSAHASEQSAPASSPTPNALEVGSVPKALGQGTESLASQVQGIVGQAQNVAVNAAAVAAPVNSS